MTNTTTQKAAFARATHKANRAWPAALTTIKETILRDLDDGEALTAALLELPNLKTKNFGNGNFFVVVSTKGNPHEVQFRRDFLPKDEAENCFAAVIEDLTNLGYTH